MRLSELLTLHALRPDAHAKEFSFSQTHLNQHVQLLGKGFIADAVGQTSPH